MAFPCSLSGPQESEERRTRGERSQGEMKSEKMRIREVEGSKEKRAEKQGTGIVH